MVRPSLLAPLALLPWLLALAPAAAGQEAPGAPLSVIDWLSQSVAPAAVPAAPSLPAEPPVAADASTPAIAVTPLDPPAGIWAGLLPPAVTGLPRTIWQRSDPAELLALIGAEAGATLPALDDLLVVLLLAQADPPAAAREIFLARVDRLLGMGALPQAQALLEQSDLLDPDVFRRWFDVTLLTGTEADACRLLGEHPALAPTLMARVFCLARNGDWPAAALTLATARALGDVSAEEGQLLEAFLDPELAEPEGALPPPSRPTPLTFRLREAVGGTVVTAGLPLAFAHADLRPMIAWRAQIEAAERLARQGVLSENVLLGLYTARAPAASGGVWDRVRAVQALDRAVAHGDAEAAAQALPGAWATMAEARLLLPLGQLFGGPLAGLGLGGEAGKMAFRLGLLSADPVPAALARDPATLEEALWRAIALDEVAGLETSDPAAAAVLAGLQADGAPESLAPLLAEGRRGEAALRALAAFGRGLHGDHAAVAEAVAALRALGHAEAAREAALQFLVLGGAR
jgi:hypothetical protein